MDVYTFVQNRLESIEENLSVNDVKFPEEGQIELNISMREVLNFSLNKEYYFFPSDESVFISTIQDRLQKINNNVLDYPSFKPEIITKEIKIINDLNDSQKQVLQILINQGLQGLVQGPG